MSLKRRFIFILIIILLCAATFVLFGYLSITLSNIPKSNCLLSGSG